MNNINKIQPHNVTNWSESAPKYGALLGLLIGFIPLLIIGNIGEWLGDGTASGGTLINIGYVLSLLVTTVVLKQRDSGWGEIGLGRPASWLKTILLGIGTTIIYILVANVLMPVFLELLPLPAFEPAEQSNYASLYHNFPMLLLYVTLAWTIIPFGEEMMFRAFLMDSLALFFQNSKAQWALSLIGSSILFGLAHFSWGLPGVIQTIVMGLVLGAIFLKTGRNLWVTIISHGILNTLIFTLIYSGII